MDATLKLWVVIFAVGLLNYLSRLSFIAVFARRAMPPLLARALKYVPAAMLTALVVPMVMGDVGAGNAMTFNHSWCGAAAIPPESTAPERTDWAIPDCGPIIAPSPISI